MKFAIIFVAKLFRIAVDFFLFICNFPVIKKQHHQQQQQQRNIQETFKQTVTNYVPLQYKGTVGRDDNDVQKEKTNRPCWLISCVIKWRRNTRDSGTMGNTQTPSNQINKEVSSETLNKKSSIAKSRRGSRSKVSGLLNQKKPSKGVASTTPITTITTIPSSVDSYVKNVKKVDQQHHLQQHNFNKYYDFGEDGSDDNETDDNLTRRVRLEKMKIAAIIQSVDIDIETCNKDDEEESGRTISTILNYDRTVLPANYDHEALKDFLTSSDSLFTEPLSPQSCKTSPTEFISDQCFTPDIEINNYAAGQKVVVKNPFPYHTLSNNKSPSALNILNERRKESGERPVSCSSFISADTSSILSPITSKAIADLQRRHQADKLSQLSVTKTIYLELPPTVLQLTGTETGLSIELESTHEEMAAHLGKKLSQVLSGSGSSSEGNASINGVHNPSINSNSTGTSNTVDQMTVCLARPATVIPSGDIFNIAKAKKVELPKLSSSLLTTDSLNIHAAILDSKLVPSPLTEQQTTTSLSLTKPSMSATEAQSTVIISFKSSSSTTPVQSQQTHSAQQTETECILPNRNCYCTPAATTETLSLTKQPTNGLPNTSQPQDGTTALYTSVTPKNNVLNKVASFTLEKTGMLISNHNMNNGGTTSCLGTSPYLENSNSKHYVSKKLDFTFYEKFEGQMLLKWLMSSLQTHNMHNTQLREQDIEALTLQYCNNLIQVGALKQISEKNDLETFSPFQMYQWTHTEAPIASHVLTPRKLDKAAAWPYCSTPAVGSAAHSAHKSVQVGGPQSIKKLLNSSTLPEFHALINDSQSLRKHISTRVLAMDLLNDSEKTVHQQEAGEGTIESSCGYESGVQEVAVQTDLLMNQEMCVKCQCNSVTKSKRHSEKEVQVDIPSKVEALPLKVDKPVDAVPKTTPPIKCASVPPTPPPPPPPPLLIPKTTPPPPPMPESAPKPPPLPLPNDLTNIKSNSPPPPPAVSTLNSTTSSLESSKSTTATKPAPLPNPTEGGWFCQTNTMRKMPVNPPKPMKPLYWTRIVTSMLTSKPNKCLKKEEDEPDSRTSTTEKEMKEIWQEINETHLDNIDEFTELFSRQAVVPTKRPIEKTAARVKTLKVLDSERSRNVGIVSRSLHVDFCEIEHAIYHVDTSVVSLETLQQIISIKASDKELELIGEAAQSCIPLDYPEQFLWKISQISMSTERISCIVFQAEFEESTTQIERKLAVIVHLSHFLIDNDELKLVFSIILTLGNYMNGGNRQRGQADGFTLDILSKLKDVKSKDSHTTLLHFIVRTYIGRKRQEGVQIREIPLPVPEPSDVERAMQVDFEEIKNHISELRQKLNSHKTTTRKVILNSNEKTLEPFKSRMEEFAQNAGKVIDKLEKELEDGRNIFIEAMKFYHFTPKTGPFEECTPNQFFEYWTNFVNDFKDIWKKEIAALWNDLLKKARDTQNERRRNVKTTKIKPGGLKERIMRLNKK